MIATIYRKVVVAVLILTMVAVIPFAFPPRVSADPLPAISLPSGPITANLRHTSGPTYFDITFSGVGTGYAVQDVVNYFGWCIEDNGDLTSPVTARLYSSYDANLPTGLTQYPAESFPSPWNLAYPGGTIHWDQVNYLLNHKQGSWMHIQSAIWTLTYGGFRGTPPAADQAIITAMVDDARANGNGFVPQPGQTMAVVVFVDGIQTYQHGSQDAIIELTVQPTALRRGDTATIGFWHNKNGQALIKSLNGGPTSTNLATWLATNFPYLYGAHAGANDMTGKTNADVAALFMKFFSVKGQKTDAQILAGALAVYVTDSDLAGTAASSYGFNVSSSGTGARTYDVGSNGSAIGLTNNTRYTVMQLLLRANRMKQLGTFNANAFNSIFDGINTTGDRI